MNIASDRLDPQALAVQEAQDKIRKLVKDHLFMRMPRAETDKEARRIILACMAKIRSQDLKSAAHRSLTEYYTRQRRIAHSISPAVLLTFLCLTKLTKMPSVYAETISTREARSYLERTLPEWESEEIRSLGIPLNKYHQDYYKEHILPTVERMAESEARDPDAPDRLGYRSSLRNRAEREVRYQWHLDNIEELRASGNKLVIISAHADCSVRCKDYQGKVYSLDGSSGVTDDGRPYEPIETATNVLTPNGRWYNGLFGFNCRHYAVAYAKGKKFPKTSAATERREYAISQKQRYMEIQVREWRIRAEMTDGVDIKKHSVAVTKARKYNERYIRYSKANNRPYYHSRTKILS